MRTSRFFNLCIGLLLLSILQDRTGYGQGTNVIEKYRAAIEQCSKISYEVIRIDTFVTGAIWKHSGQCYMAKSAADTFTGYRFSCYRPDLHMRLQYDGVRAYVINEHAGLLDSLELNRKMLYGSPPGQLLVPELMSFDTTGVRISVSETRTNYLISIAFPDDTAYGIEHHNKILYLSKSDYLPVKILDTLHAFGARQVTIKELKNMGVNVNGELAILNSTQLSKYRPTPKENKKPGSLLSENAPSFKLPDFNGEFYAYDGSAKKIVLLDFWDTWCGPCLGAMSKVQGIHEQFKGKNLEVIGVLTNSKNAVLARQIYATKGITFLGLIADEKMREQYNVKAIPAYFILKDGKIVYAANSIDASIVEESLRR
ncbi:TlpA family protein disulfide reductase [Deminuibacter soli]|uniref:TlpA family protein disulfide reductase n=1 Tax=Deminuibacter soli TaxID=2291815 RepID=A0A3E1NGK2_9BACT|nr:TlpA disulfide reductase family protein [Deminuibacter soli]RFM27017.1 TlpA family protein disulfide reductase [Deminuibacter soli]